LQTAKKLTFRHHYHKTGQLKKEEERKLHSFYSTKTNPRPKTLIKKRFTSSCGREKSTKMKDPVWIMFFAVELKLEVGDFWS
jgi:hypothetical protein